MMTPIQSRRSGDAVRQRPRGKFIQIKLSGVVPYRTVQLTSHFAGNTAAESYLFGSNLKNRYPLRINRHGRYSTRIGKKRSLIHPYERQKVM